MDLDEYFSTGPARERPIFERVMAHLSTLVGDHGETVYVEPVSVGIFLKGRRTFAQLRPMSKWVALSFNLDRKLESKRLSRKVVSNGGRFFHVINVAEPDQIDDEIRDWLTEAFLSDVAG